MSMKKRLKLDFLLRNYTKNVYYQQPEGLKMFYPCIRYNKQSKNVKYANDKMYLDKDKYQITYIDKDPDSDIPEKMLKELPYCSLIRQYEADGMNHWILNLFF